MDGKKQETLKYEEPTQNVHRWLQIDKICYTCNKKNNYFKEYMLEKFIITRYSLAL